MKIKYIFYMFIGGAIAFSFFHVENNCWHIISKNIIGNSMYPLIKNNEIIDLHINFYKCNSLNRWDIIAYNFWSEWKLYIKKLYIFPWDMIVFKENKLILNKSILKNSIWEVYKFSNEEINLLKLYINEQNRLKDNTYFIFGDNINNSNDSRKFWWIWKKDIIWKFIMN